MSKVYFADIKVKKIEPKLTLPAKFKRMLKQFKFKKRAAGKNVGIKMHFGGNLGYTTIHPLFIRILVKELMDAGAKSVKVMDNNPADAIPRGYVREVLGCEVVSCFGQTKQYLYKEKMGLKNLDHVFFGGEAVDCDFFIDLSHVKGHGDCGFGGALKNIAMGVVNGPSRAKLHLLEGGIVYHPEKCTFCKKCLESCPRGAIRGDKENKKVHIFFHHCTYCQHCVMTCPEGALEMGGRKFEDFSKGMAKVTWKFLKKFKQEETLFINFLTNITIYCDCWGLTTPSLVPDIGILASDDITAVEKASLDMIKTEDLLPQGIPEDRELLEGDGHLFERLHAKDPYLMVNYLGKYMKSNGEYSIVEVK
ncbi:MAG: DUF362 domain-containing protein [Fibrobacterota bacterium]